MEFKRIDYKQLNARQKETYNFQKVSSIFAEYGFATIKLNDDWNGADFIAQHIDGDVYLKVQLKGRLTFDRKYIGKDLYIAFRHNESWFLYPHDLLLDKFLEEFSTQMATTTSWVEKGNYTWSSLSPKI
ncbi:hypothetical protein [Galbibacter mesophilus]|uniref:hypothetical protein n=1 Tax=Galbibacter mesophilus TaxID=379069 RepID=UPI00191DA9D1|nr:hypothetical protein [Galbibacter mesophilus]MCM5661985.1 hypothetical protein [Galbibacter mesophilus]